MFGVAGVAVVALLTMCRPASATEFMFSFTAAQLEAAIDSIPASTNPFIGACGTSGYLSDCGVFDITAVPDLGSYMVDSTSAPASGAPTGWLSLGSGSGATVVWEDEGGAGFASVAFVNTATSGFLASGYPLFTDPGVHQTGSQIAGTAVFTATISSSDFVIGNTVPWTINVDAVKLFDSTDLKPYVASFTLDAVTTPEPATLGFILPGLLGLAWAVRRKRRV